MKSFFLSILIFITAFKAHSQAPNWQWAKQSIGDGHDYGVELVVDAVGNSYLTGTFQPPFVIIGQDTLTASTAYNSGFYVAKYDPNGNPVWARTISGVASMNSTGISLNNSGDMLVVTGYYKSTGYISFGSDSISSGTSFFETYLAKYDTAGNSMWTLNGGPSAWNGQINYDVDMDDAGNTYMTGPFEDSTYLKTFDPAGSFLWGKKFVGGMINTFFWSVAVNPAGESIVAGYFSNTSLLFDTILVPLNSNGYTIVLVKTDAQGNVVWVKNDGLVASLYKPDIAIDATDNFYVTGYFNGSTCVFGNTTLTNLGADDIFLVRYDPSGNVIWARSAGGFHYDQGISVATDQQSNCYITGLWRAVAAFGPHNLFNNGDPDVFVAKYDVNGNALWANQAGGDLVENGNSIAVDDSSNCYVTGRFTSPAPSFDMIVLQNSSPPWFPNELFIARLGADTLTTLPELQVNATFAIYPNPLVTSSELIMLQSSVENTLELFDIRGALLRRVKIHGNKTTIQRESLSPGTYVLRVISQKGVSSLIMNVE